MNVEQSFRIAKQLHANGHILAAANAYQEILSFVPSPTRAQTAAVQHALGFALYQLGRPEHGRPLIEASLRARPMNPDGWVHLAACTAGSSQPDAKDLALIRAQLLAPGKTEAYLVQCRTTTGGLRTAAARRAQTTGPAQPDVWHELALGKMGEGRASEAAVLDLKRSLTLASGSGRPGAAIFANRWCDLARCLREVRRPGKASNAARYALILQPNHGSSYVEMSAANLQLDQVRLSEQAARRAAVLYPLRAEPYANLAECGYRRGALATALAQGQRARILSPHSSQILTNIGSYHLALGNFREGWRLVQNRPGRKAILSRYGAHPIWSGEPCAVLRVLAEQGLGDELMFSTCWPDLAEYVRRDEIARVEVEVDPRLIELAQRSFPELVFFPRNIDRKEDFPLLPANRIPSLATGAPVGLAGDVTAVVRPSLERFPGEIEPLRVRGEVANHWREWRQSGPQHVPSIGLCWRSGLRSEDRGRHYPDITDLGPILKQDARFVVLQYDDCAEEVARANDLFESALIFPEGLDRKDDLSGMAALIGELDLVISADTAILALAGRMNIPCLGLVLQQTWVGLGTERRPFFPSVELVIRRIDANGAVEGWANLAERAAGVLATRLFDERVVGAV